MNSEEIEKLFKLDEVDFDHCERALLHKPIVKGLFHNIIFK